MYQDMFGKEYRDVITGFKGICTGVTMYISGCSQALICPPVKKDGTLAESEWFDIQRLRETSKKQTQLNNDETPGFDKPAPKR
jgi:hypothetical protein